MSPPAGTMMAARAKFSSEDTLKHDPMVTDDLGIDEPQRWPLSKKLAVTFAGSGYAFITTYGATAYTTGIKGVMAEFDVSMTKAILPFSLYIWGIFFAPLYSPHVSEKLGRNRFYAAASLGLAVFTLGAAYSKTYTQLAVCRFFAGLFGGSNVVQVEGTYADVWPAMYTSSYYVGIAAAQYFGAATGAIIGFHVVPTTDWRYTQYTTLMFVLAALLLGCGVPETYRRELVRRRAKALKQPSPLTPALSGATLPEMMNLTLLRPLIMFASEPLVTIIALYLGLNFGVLFSYFILVPVVLEGVAKYTPQQVGSAFATAIGGTAAAVIFTFVIDQVSVRLHRRKNKKTHSEVMYIEHRMYSVMFGAVLFTTSLFWIGWTANAKFHPVVPIVGNGISVMGSAMTLIGFVSYLFDVYDPPGILSALTTGACFRLALAGAIPLAIVPAVNSIGGAWALSTFGFISVAFLPIPFVVYFFGQKLRANSRFRGTDMMSPMGMQMKEEVGSNHSSEDAANEANETAA